MKKELNPAIVWGAIAVVAIVVIVIGYKVLGPTGFKADQTGSEREMERVLKKGERMYNPPVPLPGGPGGGMPQPPEGGLRAAPPGGAFGKQ